MVNGDFSVVFLLELGSVAPPYNINVASSFIRIKKLSAKLIPGTSVLLDELAIFVERNRAR